MTDKKVFDATHFDEKYFNDRQTSNYQDYSLESVYPAFIHYATALKAISKCHRILDIGCAKGYFVLAFKRLQVDGYGVDISRYAIDNGHPEVKNKLSVLNNQTQPLPFPDNYFDLIVSSEVIEHISDHHLLLTEINRVLSPNGLIFLTTPTHNLFHKDGTPFDKTHVSVFPRKKWLKIFQQYLLAPVIGLPYLHLIIACATGMCQVPPGSSIGQKLKKLGRLGSILRFMVYLFDLSTHYQTDIFLLRKE